MTERLYYTDAMLVDFQAAVVGIEGDGKHIILDRTAFYPTSGGQLHDIGRLGDATIVDVIDDDERVVHVCAEPARLAIGDVVEGRVDWTRRFDHMQQHTAQHLLSALLADEHGWPTVSVHFGDVTNTVDVTAGDISPVQLVAIEQRVNRLAAENRAVTVSFEDAAAATGLRKPSDRGGMLRIITIDGLDRSACGGTHVSRTGEIGSILLRRTERTKGNTRIEFVCGLRAVARARLDSTLLSTSARTLTASPEDLPALVEAQLQRIAEMERERKRLVSDIARLEASKLWSESPADANGLRHIRLPALDGAVRDAEPLVQALVAMGSCVVLALSPSTGGVMLGAAEGAGVDAGQTLRAALQSVSGRGGGSPRLAQGTVPDKLVLEAVSKTLGF
jgi:alanyl-tRNA synthetase